MTQATALLASATLVCVIGLHLALVAGAPLGQFAWGGQEKLLSGRRRLGSFASALILAIFAWVILIHGDVLERSVPVEWTRVALWVFTAQFALNTVANLASKSRPEKIAMGSATAVLTVCCLLLALSI